MGHRRRSESQVLPSREPHAGLGVSAVERAEKVLNRWALGKRPEPLRSRLRSLQRNPQRGGSLLTGHYGRLLWRPSAPKHHNWRLSPPLPS